MASKAFSKINNPKDLSLIRVFVKEALISKGVKKIQGKKIKHCKNKPLEYTYRRVFKSDPTIDYLEDKRINREEGRFGQVYLMGNREYGLVKIGFSNNPEQRLKELQTGCPFPISIFTSFKGSLKREKQLHHQYKDLRVNGEWFKIEDKLEDFINKY